MSQIIDGKKIAEKIKNEITQEIYKIGQRPNLAIILVGEREDSKLYVKLKEQEAKKVGIDTHLYKCASTITEDELLQNILFLNEDSLVDAVLIQLPLPEGFDTDKIIKAINPTKDVDRFHPENIKKFTNRNNTEMLPPVYGAIFEMLNNISDDLSQKTCCIISNSKIFGDNLAKLFKNKNCQSQNIKKDNPDLKKITSQADILISAVGDANFIKKDAIKKDGIVIDVGISRQNDKICGDVDFDDVEDKTSFISTVPGGIGPVTIAMTFQNTLKLYKQKNN